jgi:hypothetical protein
MKKKIFISMFAIAAMALTAFTGYKTLGPQKSTSDLLLDENIEALTQGEFGGYYLRDMHQCLKPCDYKQSVTCKLGGNEECSPSDCC